MKLLEIVLHKAFIWTLFIVVFPITLSTALFIFVVDGSPIFFTQKRVGKRGKIFALFKFRTMIPRAEEIKANLAHLNEAKGPVFKIRHDPRFTPLGSFLSHIGYDELPQLINILKGEMALIGPRPLPIHEAKKLKKWQQVRQTIKPGIISPWILNGYHENTFDNWMLSDIAYVEKKSIIYDTILLCKASVLLLKLLCIEIKEKVLGLRKTRRSEVARKKKQPSYSVN